MAVQQYSLGELLDGLYDMGQNASFDNRRIIEEQLIAYCYRAFDPYCNLLGVFNRADRDIIISESIVTIFKKASQIKFDNEKKGKAYLYKIVYYKYCDWLKSKVRRSKIIRSIVEYSPFDLSRYSTSQPPNNHDINYCIELIKTTLNEKELDLFILIETGRVSIAAFAQKLNVSGSAIRHKKIKIRRKLKERLAREPLDRRTIGISFRTLFEEELETAFQKFKLQTS